MLHRLVRRFSLQEPVKWPLHGLCLSSYSGSHFDCAIREVLRLWFWFSSESPGLQLLLSGTVKSTVNRANTTQWKRKWQTQLKESHISYSSVTRIFPFFKHTGMPLMQGPPCPSRAVGEKNGPLCFFIMFFFGRAVSIVEAIIHGLILEQRVGPTSNCSPWYSTQTLVITAGKYSLSIYYLYQVLCQGVCAHAHSIKGWFLC